MTARDRAELARLHELAVELEDAAASMRADAADGVDFYEAEIDVEEFATDTEALCKGVRAALWKLLDGKLYTKGDKQMDATDREIEDFRKAFHNFKGDK